MLIRNTSGRFGVVSKGFHWAIAVLIIGMLALGLYMTSLEPSPGMLKLYFWHKSIGITILTLAVLRLVWRLSNVRPAPLPNHHKWERVLATLTHFLLYGAMLTMPLSGWIMSSAKGYAVNVFGWFTLPHIVAPSEKLAGLAVTYHEYVAYALIGLLGLHAAGALKHHIIDRDDTLRRMLPFGRAALVAFALGGLGAQAMAQEPPVTQWAISPADSTLSFTWTEMGVPYTGTFGTFEGDIAFDPDRLAESRVTIRIAMMSANAKSADKNAALTGKSWFDVESFPESVFTAESFEKTGDHDYVAHGTLKIRDITLPLDLPFTLDIVSADSGNKVAKMKADITLSRLDFKVGSGEWEDTETVANPVKVGISLTARTKAATPAPAAATP